MAKKSFVNKENPALNFISKPSIEAVDGKPEATSFRGNKKAPEGYKLNPEFIELKNKRVQILTQPSLFRDAKAIADELGISMNDFINRAMQEAVYDEYVLNLIKKDVRGEE